MQYNCPSCRTALESDLIEAGSMDQCPKCKRVFNVPGVAILKKRRDEELQREQVAREVWQQMEAKRHAEQQRVEIVRRNKQVEAEKENERRLEIAAKEGFRFIIDSGSSYRYDEKTLSWRELTHDENEKIEEAVRCGYSYIHIDGRIYIYIEAQGQWKIPTAYEIHCINHAAKNNGRPWFEGPIISRNHGNVIVPPFIKSDGTKVVGYTRNASGYGPAEPRQVAVELDKYKVASFKF